MKLIGLMPARNEDWIIGWSARIALRWCDELIVLNHASTDRTAEILAEIPGVHVIEETGSVWAEMAHRQRLIEEGRRRGGTHFAIVDADEVLTANLLDYIRGWIGGLRPGTFLQLGMPCMRSLDAYQTNDIWGRANVTVAFADREDLHWRSDSGYDFHHREPYNAHRGAAAGREHGGVMHYQFAHCRRLLAKHALYQMTEVLRWPGRKSAADIAALYSMAPRIDNLEIAYCPPDWIDPYRPLLHHLDLKSEPWQEAEVRRLWKEHGPQKFAGLNLFGLVEKQC